jgi:hypothetical protein
MQDYPQGAGSGIVWDKQGHVVTNFHVIKGATSVQVLPLLLRSFSCTAVPPSFLVRTREYVLQGGSWCGCPTGSSRIGGTSQLAQRGCR